VQSNLRTHSQKSDFELEEDVDDIEDIDENDQDVLQASRRSNQEDEEEYKNEHATNIYNISSRHQSGARSNNFFDFGDEDQYVISNSKPSAVSSNRYNDEGVDEDVFEPEYDSEEEKLNDYGTSAISASKPPPASLFNPRNSRPNAREEKSSKAVDDDDYGDEEFENQSVADEIDESVADDLSVGNMVL
jgi:hypothetical protein